MRKALIAVLAGGALAAAALPALAQTFDSSMREANIGERINTGLQDGDLSMDQAGRLRGELNQIVNLDARYQDEGMNGWQSRDLDSRLSLLASRLDYDLSVNRGDAGY